MILGMSAALTCLGFVFGACGIAHAEEDSAIRTLLNDTGQYFSAPLRWDLEEWTYFGLSGAAVAAAHEFDSKVRSHFARGSNAVLDGKNRHSLRDAVPALALIAGTWATAGYLGDDDGYRETWRLVEAGAFSSVTATALGLAAGRKRPDATISPNQWRKGGDSFPSVHVSAAFAIGGTFAESGNDEIGRAHV